MPGTLAPTIWTLMSNAGVIIPGGKIRTKLAGTSTDASVYTNATLTVAHANPVVADAYGRIVMYLDELSYKFQVYDADDVLLYTVDPVPSTGVSQSTTASQFQFGGDSTSDITLTSYPSGATADKLHAGTAIFNIDSGDLPAGNYGIEAMLIGNGGTITCALVNLSDGAPDTALVTITSTSTTGERKVSTAITFATAGSAKDYGIKVKVSAGSGFCWGVRLVRL